MSSSPAELRFGCLRMSAATSPSSTSGGAMPRQKPSSATGRRLSHQARNTTAARRPRSVGWSDMKPRRSHRVAPFDMWPITTTIASSMHAPASSHGASVSSRRRLSREHANSAASPNTVRTSCWRRKWFESP
jgi:hypothetical protein